MKSYKKTIWQEEIKYTRFEEERQNMAESQEYPFKSTLKEVGPEKIQTL